MKGNKGIMAVAVLGCVGMLCAVAGQEKITREAEAAADNPTEQVARKEAAQKAPAVNPAVNYPDYAIGLFSHKAHSSGAGLQCTDCHTTIFQMSAGAAKASGDFNKISFGEGKYCGACHNGSAVFAIQDVANCTRCHGNNVNPPETILLEKPLKGILFNHALHNRELGLACNECHMRLFDMKVGSTGEKGDFTMEAMYNGKYCGACHNGSMAFNLKTGCTKCHTDLPGDDRAPSGSDEKKAGKGQAAGK